MRIVFRIVAGVLLAFSLFITGAVIHANLAIAREETKAPAEGAPGRMLTISGRQWHVLTRGNLNADPTGAPILLIHGFVVAGAETFQPWANTQLGERSLILPDLLGYGHSSRVATAGPWYSLAGYSDAIAKMLDQLGVAQVDVVGHSNGGTVAAQFALDHPNRVRRIVFMDAGIYVEPSAGESIIHLPLGIGRAVAWHTFGGGPWSINALVCKRRGCRWGDFARVENTTDSLRAMMRSHREYTGPVPLVDRMPRLRTPSLVIWGEHDNITPLSHGQRLARETRARLVVIPGAAHMPHLQRTEEVGRQVREFLQPVSGS